MKPGYEPQPEAAEEDDIRIEKRKTFAMKPQSAEEIVDEMLAIRSEIDAWKQRKQSQEANARINEILNDGL